MISEGIGRGNIQMFEPMGKMKMSKGKPIKLSSTHSVFFAQSSRSWLRKLFPWDGKCMEVKFKVERLAIFGKHVFDLWGK